MMDRENRRIAVCSQPDGTWVLALVLTLCACMGPEHSSIPFEYPSMAAGNEGVRDVVILPPGKEQRAVSDAVFRAVQSLGLSIVKPEVAAGQLLPAGQVVETDYVRLDRKTIERHNRSSGVTQLHHDIMYRLSYRLEYSMGDKRIDLRMWARIQRRGSGGEWHEDSSDYSGRFFTDRLRSEIESTLKRARK